MKEEMLSTQNKIVEEENAKLLAEQQLENLKEIGLFLKEKVQANLSMNVDKCIITRPPVLMFLIRGSTG